MASETSSKWAKVTPFYGTKVVHYCGILPSSVMAIYNLGCM